MAIYSIRKIAEKTIMFILFICWYFSLSGQQKMTMADAVLIARERNVGALEAKHEFISKYWAYRTYQVSRRPSLVLYGNILNYNKSLTKLQSYDDGSVKYVNTYNLQNSVGIEIMQNVTCTGGRIFLYSDLSRIDQYGPVKKLTWYSQPITFRYVQPFFSYNQFKWDKLIEPKEYEKGRRKYIESMEKVTLSTVTAYFSLIKSTDLYESAKVNYENTVLMLSVASQRMRLGTISKDEYLQLELRAINDSVSINEASVSVREAQMALNSALGYDALVEIEPVVDGELPEIIMDYDMVLNKALSNSAFELENDIDALKAAASVAKAKADRGISMSLNARFGLSQTSKNLPLVYRDLLNQEVIGLSFTVPIFDWGLGDGKIQKAKAAEDVVRAQIVQSENDYKRKIFTAVGQFNNQRNQCKASRRAMEISYERHSLTMEKFRKGSATVTDLTNAQNDNDAARRKYLSDLANFWNFYYDLRKYTLYDFISGCDLDIDINEITK